MSHYWFERVTMERNHRMSKDEKQMDQGLDMERDDGGNGGLALDEEVQ